MPEGRGLCPHPKAARLCLALRLKPFEKGFKNSKTFMTKRIDFLPRVCEQRTPSIVLLIKVLLQFQTLGATSPCMGKFRLQTERYCRKDLGTTTLNPLPIRVTSRGIKNRGVKMKVFAKQKASSKPHRRCPPPYRLHNVTLPRYNISLITKNPPP